MSVRVAHWVRPNAAARMPRRVVTLDSEAVIDFDGQTQTQTFRCAVAAFDLLDTEAQPTAKTEWLSTESTGDLWKWIDQRTSTQHRTVVFAHKLDYDLRLTCALTELPALGWELKRFGLNGRGAWLYLRRRGRSLYLVDSLSHIPVSLDRIAGMLNRRRPRLPAQTATADQWLRRCTADVRVLREAVLQTLDLYHQHECGDFRTTGAGQASAAFRHRFLEPSTLLVHADPDVLAVERRAGWSGRAEVWRHGEIEGPLYEYDYDAAYARIALETELPVALVGEYRPPDLALYDRVRQRYAVVAEVEVETPSPVVPTDHAGGIVWPVGTFTSTLWDCEIELARREGARVDVRRLWAYRRAPLLAEWADWILRGLAGDELGATPIGRTICKEWSRALIGRFALRYPTVERIGRRDFDDLCLWPVDDRIEGRVYSHLQVGRALYEQTDTQESPSSTPCVMAYVMAAARVKVWQAIQAAGFGRVISVDTDGLIVGREGAALLDTAIRLGQLPGLRRKAEYRRGSFRGPRNLDLDDSRRVSGVPRRAERLAPGDYRGEVWESLPAALKARRATSLTVYERRFRVDEHDPRRLHLPDGSTDPIRLGLAGSQLAASIARRAAGGLAAAPMG